MTLKKLKAALEARTDIAGWTVQHITRRGAQVYGIMRQTEAKRLVDEEVFKLSVLRSTKTADGGPAVGSGELTLLPGADFEAGIEQALLTASMMANPVYGLPEPARLPDVKLVDADLQRDPAAAMHAVLERILRAGDLEKDVQLTAAECIGEVETTHLINSRGIDAEQSGTTIEVEFTLRSHRGDRDAETFTELTRRSLRDLDIESDIAVRARHTLDLLEAGESPSWQGPVVVRWRALASMLADEAIARGVLQTMGSAGTKYAKVTPWELGKSVFRGEVKGDPLTVWANRVAPYGTHSGRFDAEGLPGQRLELIRDNVLSAFSASQRYAEYLGIPATGAFGMPELPPGKRPAAALLTEPHVEVIQFSWFNPEPITGDFAAEIRFGYFVENGRRKPFKGGLLIGNLIDALANVHWSTETAFFGSYLGPHTARFNDLKVAGEAK